MWSLRLCTLALCIAFASAFFISRLSSSDRVLAHAVTATRRMQGLSLGGVWMPAASRLRMSQSDMQGDADNMVEEGMCGEGEGGAVGTETEAVPGAEAAAAAAVAAEEDPHQKHIKELEMKLTEQVADLEAALRSERLNLSKVKDQVGDAGKNGYFIVQAQVAEFLKKNDNQQKLQVTRNKREFFIKMLPVVCRTFSCCRLVLLSTA